MPVDACGHVVIDRSGAPSNEDMEVIRQVAPHIIQAGLMQDKNYGFSDFRNDIINDPDFGGRFLSVINQVYNNAAADYRSTVRQEGLPLLLDSAPAYIPAMDSFYSGADAEGVKIIYQAAQNLARAGTLKDVRGGVDILTHEEVARRAGKVTWEEMANPNDIRPEVGQARKLAIDQYPNVIKDKEEVLAAASLRASGMEDKSSTFSSQERSNARLNESIAAADLDLTHSMFEHIIAVDQGVTTNAARYIHYAQRVSGIMRHGIPESREFFDTFDGTLNEPLALPADHKAQAAANPLVKGAYSYTRELAQTGGIEPPEYPRIPRPSEVGLADRATQKKPATPTAPTQTQPKPFQTSENKPVAPRPRTVNDSLSVLENVSKQAETDRAKAARIPGAQKTKKPPKVEKTPEGVKLFNDAIRKIEKDKGKEEAKARREEYKKTVSAEFDRFWSATPGTNKPGGRRGAVALPEDILPTESLDALKNIVKATAKLGQQEFQAIYRTIRDTTPAMMDWNGPNGERVNHVEALAMAYEKAFPGKEVPKSVLDDLRRENLAQSEKAYRDVMKQTGGELPPKGQLFNPRVAEVARKRLEPPTYVRLGDRNRRTDTTPAMNYFGGFVFSSLKMRDGKAPSYGKWVGEMRNATGTDLTAADLEAAWGKMKEASYVNTVQPKLDAKAKMLNDASVRLTADQYQKYRELIKGIPDDDPNRAARYNHAYRQAKGSIGNAVSTLTELNAAQRAIRFSYDWSVTLTHLASVALDPRRMAQTLHNLSTAVASGMDSTIEDAAFEQVRNVDDPMHEYYHRFGRQMFDPALKNNNEIFSSQWLNRLSQESLGVDMTDANQVGAFRRLKRKGSVVELDLGGLLGAGGVKAKVGARSAEFNPLKDAARSSGGLANKALRAGLIPNGLGYMKGGEVVRGAGKINIDLNPLKGLARGVASSERSFATMLVLTRKALFDTEFQRLTDMGYDPNIDHQVFQSTMDNIAIFTGSSNLGKDSAEIIKNYGKLLSAPRYQLSQAQQLFRPLDAIASVGYDAVSRSNIMSPGPKTRIEDYKPSTKTKRQTPLHGEATNSLYLARYMPHAARVAMWDHLGGVAGGTLLYAYLGALMGAEVQEDPRHKNSFQLRFKNYTFPLPGSGVWNWLRFLYTTMNPANPHGGYLAAPSSSSPKPGMVVKPGQVGYQYNSVQKYLDGDIASASKNDRAMQFARGKMAPSVQLGWNALSGRNAINQPVYMSRLYNNQHKFAGLWNSPEAWKDKGFLTPGARGLLKDIIEDTAPLSPSSMVEIMRDADAETKEKVLALMSLSGMDGRPTKFKKDKDVNSY